MKNRITPLLAILLLSTGLSYSTRMLQAQENPSLLEDEIRTDPVEFQNRSNARASVRRREMDTDLGKILAITVREQGTVTRNGFRITRVFNPEEDGYGADTVEILPDARFGHINVIQRVLSGYLAESFQYGRADSQVLAQFLLYYNAKVKSSWKDISSRYSSSATAAAGNSPGISTRYQEWPGQTTILLPLKKSLVRPGETDLSHGEVEKETHDATTEEKKDLNEVQERRKEDDLRKLDDKKREIQQEKKELKEENTQLKKEEQQIKEEKKQNDQKLTELKKEPEKNQEEIKKTEEKQQDLTRKEQENKQAQDENQQRTEEVTKEEQAVDQQVADTKSGNDSGSSGDASGSQSQENLSKEEVKQIVEENKTLKEEKKKEEEMSDNVVGEKILFLKIIRYIEGGHYNNELWQIDPVKDDTLKRGPFTNICGKEFVAMDGAGVVVIGYDDGAHSNEKHHLVLLDSETLAKKAMTTEEIFWRTPLIEKDGMLYAIEVQGTNHFLVRYKPDMTLDKRSDQPVNPNSEITFFREKIYMTGQPAQNSDATAIQVFDRKELKLMKSIAP